MNKVDYAKALKKQKQTQERAAKKRKIKQACPTYQAEQISKAKAQRERQVAKQIENRNRPLTEAQKQKKDASIAKQQENQRASVARSILKAKDKVITKSSGAKGKVKPKAPKSKERSVTKAEKVLHNKMAQLGCIVCRNKGLGLEDMDTTNINYISIHHTDGRTKINCHLKSLPLCQWHHDCPMPKAIQKLYPNVFPIHAKGSEGGKSAWEKENGTQKELIKQVWELIGFSPVIIEFDRSSAQIELAEILAA